MSLLRLYQVRNPCDAIITLAFNLKKYTYCYLIKLSAERSVIPRKLIWVDLKVYYRCLDNIVCITLRVMTRFTILLHGWELQRITEIKSN